MDNVVNDKAKYSLKELDLEHIVFSHFFLLQ